MFKELILAVALGSLLGFGVTGGYLAIKKSQTNNSPQPSVNITPTISVAGTISPSIATPTISQTSTGQNQITLDSPENETIVTNSQLTIKGTTNPQSRLVVTTPTKVYYSAADTAGNFSLNIEIDSGINQIQIDSIDAQDNQANRLLMVTYSTAKF